MIDVYNISFNSDDLNPAYYLRVIYLLIGGETILLKKETIINGKVDNYR